MIKMTWKILFGLIYILKEVPLEDSVPRKEQLSFPSKSEICARREEIEKQHQIDYLANEVLYRSWPELHQNPKHDCQRFLQKIYHSKKKVDVLTATIRNVILNYKHIRNEDNNMSTPKSVTALECKLSTLVWRCKCIYFIRSQQSPKCALILKRTGKRGCNFYIVEEICEHIEYTSSWKYIMQMREISGNLERSTNKYRQQRRQMLLLPNKEIRIKHAELEQRHYEYYSSNAEMCIFWPEVQIIPEFECQRFLKRMLPNSQDLTLVTAKLNQMKLFYLEIRNENDQCLNPVVVNAIACQLLQPIKKCTHVYFIRAPSFPSCVFYGVRRVKQTQQFYITEEICDTPGYETSLDTIILEHEKGLKFGRKVELYGPETYEKLQVHERTHFTDFSINKCEYEQWPELKEMNMKSYCQTLVNIMFSKIEKIYDSDKFTAAARLIKLKYARLSGLSNEAIPPLRVKALECIVSEEPVPNRFQFIRTPKPNNCVYWIRRKNSKKKFYFITREVCKDDAGVLISLENELGLMEHRIHLG